MEIRDGELDLLRSWLTKAAELLRSHFERGVAAAQKRDGSLVTVADEECDALLRRLIGESFPDDGIWSEETDDVPGQGSAWIVDPLDGTTNFAHGFPHYAVSIARVELGEESFAPVVAGIAAPSYDWLFLAGRGAGATLNGKSIAVADVAELRRAHLATGIYYLDDQPALERELAAYSAVSHRCQRIRRHGAGALDLATVAAGIHHGFWQFGLAPWDIAAGTLLVTEAGGVILDYAGTPAPLEKIPTAPFGLLAATPAIGAELHPLLRGPVAAATS